MINVLPDRLAPEIPASVTPSWIDPDLLGIARQLYREYYYNHTPQMRRPLGVVVHRRSHRAMVVFSHQPVLLWDECLIPLERLESELS